MQSSGRAATRSNLGISIPRDEESSTAPPSEAPAALVPTQKHVFGRSADAALGSNGEESIPLSTSAFTAGDRSPDRMSALNTGPSWLCSSPTNLIPILRTLMLELSHSLRTQGTIVLTPFPSAEAPKSTQVSICHFRRASWGRGLLMLSMTLIASADIVFGDRTTHRDDRRGGEIVVYFRSAILSTLSATASLHIQFSGGCSAVACTSHNA
mmetsp:Transcript_28161/g.61879  ORF Transcript_28161/g.61879 Transcript_28161/m.61879 type:complete len:211 (+) Transcript_28161:513-1145(+)